MHRITVERSGVEFDGPPAWFASRHIGLKSFSLQIWKRRENAVALIRTAKVGRPSEAARWHATTSALVGRRSLDWRKMFSAMMARRRAVDDDPEVDQPSDTRLDGHAAQIHEGTHNANRASRVTARVSNITQNGIIARGKWREEHHHEQRALFHADFCEARSWTVHPARRDLW